MIDPDQFPPPSAVIPDYDQMWEEVYGDLQNVGPVHRHMRRLMHTMLSPLQYDSVLEVGVGFGHNLPVLTAGRNVSRLCGVDISERALAHVRAHWAGEFMRLDVERQQLQTTYDLVCNALVLEHVIDDVAALRNLRAMTKQYLLLVTIGGDFKRYRPWEEQQGHVRNYRPTDLEAKIRGAGFVVLRTIRWGFPFYSPISRVLQNRMTSSHEFNPWEQLLARVLYAVYFLNSRRRGDLLIVLAESR